MQMVFITDLDFSITSVSLFLSNVCSPLGFRLLSLSLLFLRRFFLLGLVLQMLDSSGSNLVLFSSYAFFLGD